MTARRIRRPRHRYVARYLGGALGRPIPWFDCTRALEWDNDPRAYVRSGQTIRLVRRTLGS